jgi:hypothetical protein
MSDLTRRGFVKSSAGAAAGLAAFGALEVGEAEAKRRTAHSQPHSNPHSHPIVAWIGNPRDGKITIMSGKHERTIRDRKLASQLARAVK